jgi:hypothetical protein
MMIDRAVIAAHRDREGQTIRVIGIGAIEGCVQP